MKPFVSFEQISQVFSRPDGSNLMALKDVSFDIGRHEFVAVVGSSGCGKSTLLRLLSGLLKPTRGQLLTKQAPLLTLLSFLLVWEFGCRLGEVPEYLLPSPSAILTAFADVDMVRWLGHLWSTLRVALLGFVISIVVRSGRSVCPTRYRTCSAVSRSR